MKKIAVALVALLGVFFVSFGVAKTVDASTVTWRVDYLDSADPTGNTKVAESEFFYIEDGRGLSASKTIAGYDYLDGNYNHADPSWVLEPHGENNYIVYQMWYKVKTYTIRVDYLDAADPSGETKVADSVTLTVQGGQEFQLPIATVDGYALTADSLTYETATLINPTQEVYQIWYEEEEETAESSSETTESSTSSSSTSTSTSSSTSETTVAPTTEKTQKALPKTGEYVAVGLPIIGLLLAVGTLIWSKKEIR